MQNFITSKDAKIVDISGIVKIEAVENTALQIGDSLTSGTLLILTEGSGVTLGFDDGTEQRITGGPDNVTAIEDQIIQQNPVTSIAESQAINSLTPDNVQADIDAIQALIESGDDVELPDTAAGGLTANEGTDFVTLDRDGNQLLAGAGYDTGELDNPSGAAEVPILVDPIDNINALPDAVDDTFEMDENTELAGSLLGNDDLGDEATTVTAFDGSSANGGTVTVDSTGNFSYTPVPDFVGADTFTYTITDADGDTSTATVTVNIANVNKLPEAVDDSFDMDENSQLSGSLLGNDDLGDEDTTVTAFDSTSVNGGTVTVDDAGNFTYTPVTDFVGADTFTYTITDADGDTSTATVTVNIANVNKLPDAVDDTFSIDENAQLTGTLLGNDDLGDEATTVTAFDSTSVNGGAVTVDAEGNFSYTPVTDFVGSDTFTYTITDADGDTSTATVTVNIENINALPDAVDDTFGINENTQLTGTLLGNDDLGDEETTVTAFDSSSVNGGIVTVDGAGNFTYTPATDFVGADTFTYTITDADGDTSTATVTVNVANVNALPDAVDDSFRINENTQLSGTLLGNDDLGDEVTTVTAFNSTSANGGSVSVDAAGNFTYTPVTNFVGADTFTYTITDVDGDTSTATVTVTVLNVNVNALPDAVDDSFDINENSPLSGSLLGNDDLGDNPTTVTAFDNASTNGGTVNVNPDGTFSYTPAADFVGADTFTYTITDADGDTSTATVTVNVSDVNLLPDAVDDSFDINENSPLSGSLLGNDDLGDNPTTVTAFDSSSTNGGTVSVSPDGTFSYTPATDFVGADTFTYTITDADGDMSTATVTVNVANVNVPPVAADDSFGVDEGQSVSGNVITNNDGDGLVDTDGGDGAALSVTQVVVNGVTTNVAALGSTDVAIEGGTLSISANGNFTYTNSEGFDFDPLNPSTQPSFGYTLSDGTDTDTANVSITINDSAPIANDDTKSIVLEGDTLNGADSVTVSGNIIAAGTAGDVADTSVDGTVTLVSVDGQTFVDSVTPIVITKDYGQLSILSSGAYSYVSTAGVAIPDSAVTDTFSYVIEDGDGNKNESDSATLTINLTPNLINLPPEAEDDGFTVNEGATIGGNVITHADGDGVVDTDGGDGGTLKVTQVNGVDLTFDPSTGIATFTIIDGVFTAVTPADVLLFDDSTFNGALDNGILQINADGDFNYENKGFIEGATAPTFEYTLSDGFDTDTANVIITVETNAPVAVDDNNFILLTELPGNIAFDEKVIGNVISGGSTGDNDDSSSDGFGTPIITQVEYQGNLYIFSDTVTSHTISTAYGTLNIESSGVYSFDTPFGMDMPPYAVEGTDVKFTYTIQDGDPINPDLDTAILNINLNTRTPPTLQAKGMAETFDETSGLIDTDFDSKSLINADKAAFKYSPDLENLSDILTDGHTDGLESYLAAMGEDKSAIVDIDLAAESKDSLVEAVLLAKNQNNSDHGSYATVTNGLLEGGGTIISDQAAATNAPIAEFDSAELL
jgi:hypothetical protein